MSAHAIQEHTGEIDGLGTRWLEAPPGDGEPVLHVHGVPTSADMWRPFLERHGGYAPDLPGFGRSAKILGFDTSIDGYASWLESFCDARGLDRFALVVHDWGGGLGLALAQRRPEAIERLVVMDSVPLLPGYRWHRIARIWRAPVLGELAMGFTTKGFVRRSIRASQAEPGNPGVRELADTAWEHLDQGTMRTILRLYRSAPPDVLERAGLELSKLTCPALVIWGTRDPYLPTSFAQAYADALGGEARVELVEAGHWPWLDRPEVIEMVSGFVSGSDRGGAII